MNDIKLWINIAFFYNANKIQFLKNVIENILKLNVLEHKLVINSNVKFSNTLDIQICNPLNPMDIVYEHKKNMLDFLSSDFTHFLFLEDDMIFNQDNLDYWISYRDKLKTFKLLPGFHRYEIKYNELFSVDLTKIKFKKLNLNNETYILFPDEPYQGIFLMDKELVKEHFDTGFYKIKNIKGFGHLESANSSYVYCNVPDNLENRMVLPIKNFEKTLIHHSDNKYSNLQNSIFGKIKINDLKNNFVE